MAKELISVNDVRKSVLSLGSLTASVGRDSIYSRKIAVHARKSELNIAITASGSKEMIIRQVPIFDENDIKAFKSDSEANKYLHIGCCTVSIESTMHRRFIQKFGDNLGGYVALVDTTFKNLDEATIAMFSFKLSQGRADFVTYPNHYIPLTDVNLQKRFAVYIGIDGIEVEEGTELFNLCIGYIVTSANSMNVAKVNDNPSYEIMGTKLAELEDVFDNVKGVVESSFNRQELSVEPMGDDEFIKGKFKLFGKRNNVKRRRYKTLGQSKSGQGKFEFTNFGRKLFESTGPKLARSYSSVTSSSCSEASDWVELPRNSTCVIGEKSLILGIPKKHYKDGSCSESGDINGATDAIDAEARRARKADKLDDKVSSDKTAGLFSS
ncbi:putative movement protein [Citrus yellow spot virus]|nr:putative movement protein [Citrus yellow spot virus]